MYSSTSVLPVLLTILLLALDHTSEGIEYHVNQLILKLHSVLVSLIRHWLNTWKTAPGTTLPMLELCSCPDITE